MPDFNELRGKVQGLLGEHGDKAEDAIDKGAEMAGERFGGQKDQIDAGAEKLKGMMPDSGGDSAKEATDKAADEVARQLPE